MDAAYKGAGGNAHMAPRRQLSRPLRTRRRRDDRPSRVVQTERSDPVPVAALPINIHNHVHVSGDTRDDERHVRFHDGRGAGDCHHRDRCAPPCRDGGWGGAWGGGLPPWVMFGPPGWQGAYGCPVRGYCGPPALPGDFYGCAAPLAAPAYAPPPCGAPLLGVPPAAALEGPYCPL